MNEQTSGQAAMNDKKGCHIQHFIDKQTAHFCGYRLHAEGILYGVLIANEESAAHGGSMVFFRTGYVNYKNLLAVFLIQDLSGVDL
jgi:hypothetical protein